MSNGIIEMGGPFGPKYRIGSKRTPIVTGTSRFDELFELCKRLMAMDNVDDQINACKVDLVLPPAEIQCFLQSNVVLEQENNYSPSVGLITTHLVQNAIEKGFDEFRFDARGIKPLKNFCYDIHPRKDGPPPTIIVNGIVNYSSFGNIEGIVYLNQYQGNIGFFYDTDLPFNLNSRCYINKTSALYPIPTAQYCSEYSVFVESSCTRITYYQYDSMNKEKLIIDRPIGIQGKMRDAGSRPRIFSNDPSITEVIRRRGSTMYPPKNVLFEPPDQFAEQWAPAAQAFAQLEKVLAGGER